MELKECPFCGENLTGKGTTSSGRMYISCINCESEGPVGDDEQEMIDAWNTRVDPWISVDTRTPKEENLPTGWFLVVIGEGHTPEVEFLCQGEEFYSGITHWQPITPPEVT